MINFIVTTDLWFENFMLSVRTPFFIHLFSWVTFFGNPMTIIVTAGFIILVLLYKRHWPYLIGFMVALGGASVSGYLLKTVVARARPGGLIQAIPETGYSFPSGHALGSVAFYGFVAFILSGFYPQYKKLVWVVAVLFIASIGFSRLYLGVHFPSDVIAGYLLGSLWLWLAIASTNHVVPKAQ